MQAIVIHTRRYQFSDERTGEVRSGCNLTYLLEGEIDDSDERGVGFYTANVPYTVFEQIGVLPALCDLEIKTIRRKDNSGKYVPVTVPVNARVIEPIELPFESSDGTVRAVS
jgi:hypothetical protein